MNTPFRLLIFSNSSRGAVLLRRSLAWTVCLCLAHCARSDRSLPAPVPLDRRGWYIASKEPLTYCPKGHVVPEGKAYEPNAFVYLPDRRTRFYIPPRDERHKQQALAWRASAPLPPGIPSEDDVRARERAQNITIGLLALPFAPLLYVLDMLTAGHISQAAQDL